MTDKTFGVWLQRQLDRRDWNQSEFARKAGVSSGRVSDWIRDVRMPSAKSCDGIADALGLDLDEVLARAGHRHKQVDNPEQSALISLLRRVNIDGPNGPLLRRILEEMIAHEAQTQPRR